jgi:tyrosyl-DNA phosphodiesterase-1
VCFPKNYAYPINLYDYDYSSASVVLVSSVSGRYRGKAIDEYGYGRIRKIIKGTKYTSNPILTYQTSSIGMLKTKYLSDFYSAWTDSKESKLSMKELAKCLEIQYPTKSYIEGVTLGSQAASCIILSTKAYEDKQFPKNCLYKLTPIESYRGDLFHAKVAVLAIDHKIDDNTLIYIGSHNISASAWGKMEKDNTQLCIANYEMGIIFPPREGSKQMKEEIVKALTFKYPPVKYEEIDIPWMYG